MVGRIITARVKPPESIDQPKLRCITKKINPNSPKMMEGIPARQSVPKRIIRLIWLSLVYSVRKIAVPTPNGVANAIATTVSIAVPIIVENMPPSLPILLGLSIMKRIPRIGIPSLRIWTRIRIITAMVKRADVQIRILAIFCVR